MTCLLWLSYAIAVGSVLPDGPRICVPVEQSQETVSHHWHNGQTLHSESQTHSDPKDITHPEIHKRAWIYAETTFTKKYCGGTDCDPQTTGGSVKESVAHEFISWLKALWLNKLIKEHWINWIN